MSIGGSGGGTQTVQQSADPWIGAQPYLSDVYGAAQSQYRDPGPFLFPYNTFVGPNQLEMQSMDMALGAIPGMQQLANQSGGAASYALGPNMFVESNPYLQSAMNAANYGTMRQFTDTVMPSIADKAIQAGQFGADRHGVAQGMAIDSLMQNIANTNASMANANYMTGQDTMLKAMAMGPTLQSMMLGPSGVAQEVGGSQRAWDQALLDDLINRWNYYEGLPQQKLSDYASIVAGMPTAGFGTQSSTSTTPGGTDPITGAIGGGLVGGSLGYGLTSAGMFGFTPLTAPLAILGALSGSGVFS